MMTDLLQISAKIYQFPAGGRRAGGLVHEAAQVEGVRGRGSRRQRGDGQESQDSQHSQHGSG